MEVVFFFFFFWGGGGTGVFASLEKSVRNHRYEEKEVCLVSTYVCNGGVG